MLDEATSGGSTPAPRCNWCSALLPSDHETVCPSCGATLLGDGDTAGVPGLTAIDAEAILRNARAAKAKPRSRLLGWISGDYEDESVVVAAAAPGSLAPPSADVRREMLRLELEAQVANAQAEVEAMAADAAVEEGRSLAPVDADAHEAGTDDEAEAGADEAGAADEPPAEAAGEPTAAADDGTDEAPPA